MTTAYDRIMAAMPRYRAMRDRADRVAAMMMARARREYRLAFGNPDSTEQLCGCTIHNSLLARAEGKPWRGVNYRHMRKCAWLIERSFEPRRIVSRFYDRVAKGEAR
jgi:hypothetical protein